MIYLQKWKTRISLISMICVSFKNYQLSQRIRDSRFLKFLAISSRQFFNSIISLMKLRTFLWRERLMFNITFVYVKKLFLWFRTSESRMMKMQWIWSINFFFEKRKKCLIEEFFSNSNLISFSIFSLILLIWFWSNFLLYQFFRVEKIVFVSNSTYY
jgi:hypothetical protein